MHLFDVTGRRYVDMYNNVPCVGHANPHVVEAMARQQGTLNVHSRYLHPGIVTFAERLTALHGPAISSVVFSCSGSEAMEVALSMARTATGKRGIVATNATYHGNTEAVLALTRASSAPDEYPEIRTIPFPETFRPLARGLTEAELSDVYLDRVEQAIESLAHSSPGLVAVVFCSIFANEGLPDLPAGFMSRAAEMVRAAGGLVIADEVQAGYCRTGRFWGYDVTGFEPDIVVTGKPMGNGLPLAATAASEELVGRFRSATRYFNTFASSPLQAAVGMAVLDVIEGEGLEQRSAVVGHGLKQALLERKVGRDWIGDVRGHGLFVGMEIVNGAELLEPDVARTVDVVNQLKDKGFLTSNAGAYGNVVKVRPPLVFGEDNARHFVAAFDDVLAEIEN